MIKLPVSKLKPGMRLAKDVHSKDGRLLLLSGLIIQKKYITKLQLYGIPHVLINKEDVIEAQDPYERKVYSEALSSLKTVVSSVSKSNQLDPYPVKETVKSIVHQIMSNENVFMYLMGIRDIDNYSFNHSIDVCIYSIITGRSIGLAKTEIFELGVGAILHDIGKCKVPSEILLKPSKLTDKEFEIMKKHTNFGYEMLTSSYDLSNASANIALNHHEKLDGSGYPNSLSGSEIDLFSRIVAVADIYDALTADRVYRESILPHEAAEYIMQGASTLFDPKIVSAFVKSMAIYPDNMV